ncbi:glycoside hydrolase family 9 protein [uncultured Bacteroides sp.]|uniref:glycoside hydrolase family 9 protein n=1 Tax=uncultured Bacteroides sp. TaxID=162156 RepID=UPI002AA62463|nr:glycoside hydrolase family 9 protein [uncultured Bacteroides sp.]
MIRRITQLLLFLSILNNMSVSGQTLLSQNAKFEKQLYKSGLIHQPLPLDTANSFEANGWKKKVIRSVPLTKPKSMEGWSHSGIGSMSLSVEKTISGNGSIKLQFPTSTGKRAVGSKSDPDYATYGNSCVTYSLKGSNLEKYNRIEFYIYPDCDGTRVVNMNLTFVNDNTTIEKGYNEPSGSHLINLVNKTWNHCFLEIAEYQRDKVMEISFNTTLKGKDMTMGDSAIYYIDDINLQTIENPEKVSGWIPSDGKIIYSTTGYELNGPKTAIVNTNYSIYSNHFQLIDSTNGKVVYEGKINNDTTTIGQFGLIDFTAFNRRGEYQLKIGRLETPGIRIGKDIWVDSQWKALNFIFCQRCGYPVPGKHATCHVDLFSKHDGRSISYSGGWHDAGDLSQQTLQTGDVTFALLEAYNKAKKKNVPLAMRLLEEAEWGLNFILKNRYGDGYRASSMGLLIWEDGIFNTIDDISSVRVQDLSFDNFLYAGYEAYASETIDSDPMLQEYLLNVAEKDFAFAMEKHKKDGYGGFLYLYEHSYNTSESQYMATISWSASMLYKLTQKPYYAKIAAEYIRFVLDCQCTKPLNDKDGTCGFFYRDKSRKSIVHYVHQSREQVYMQAMSLLCDTQKNHPDYQKWAASIKLYGDYLKGLMKYTKPYGMVPSGVYQTEEYKDSASFYSLHIMPPADAGKLYIAQLNKGIKLDNEHFVKRFPVWFSIFNGNNSVLLSTGKSAAICGQFLNDKELLNIGREQLYWMVGKNPFGQSLIYGEGHNYPQMNSFSSGEITGEMPVGIRTLGNDDIPYWPQTNNACYKEVWVTTAGKWLSLVAEY